MSNTFTNNLQLAKPDRGDVDWDDEINGNFDSIDTILSAEHAIDGTHKNLINLGDGANTEDKKIVAHTGETNEPYLAYDVSEDQFVISDNGTDAYPLLQTPGNVLEVAKSGKKYMPIATAMADAQGGDTVFVHPGVYEEDVVVPESG